ncbi:uncharacterized protein BKA55DRAFT_517055 [Fusarium redolens]|uniref:Nucleoporin NUP82 n=1 Tax=Fusarium redolens TaxID=48865 RepID=A0A9P9GQA4_FUSRE|nr:uncharacterized protein BKA55DRAFT_517055 [Fusarium redolens]KAH7243346.1 hypothetical protein BKA55DRAFT_517055 [Fusarium redolens]
MPKVKSYSAAWLSSNAPGHRLFEPSSEASKPRSLESTYSSKKKTIPGPRRTIAHRGTEVFVAVGREIRWGDLAYLKDEWANRYSKRGSSQGIRIKREDSTQPFDDEDLESAAGLRTIKTPVADDIRQLVMSPNSNFLAILTTHTVHICVLPDPSHLTSEDAGPLKPKIFTLGPTTHVTSRSPIVSALWHPLGVSGSCIVTTTADAIVRVWELSTTDRWSFDTPTTSVDLKKLVDGTTLDQDFSASAAATNTAFSPDSFEMEVAAASFPTKGAGGWNPMTLWVAMREGDVIEDDPDVGEQEKLLAQQQLEWMGELDSQEPTIMEGPIGEPVAEIYTRPTRPGIVPRLQGPFELQSDPDTGDELDTSVTDMLVIGKKTETEQLMMGEEEDLDMDDGDQEGLSLTVICLLSTSGQVRVYLDLEGVQAQWLPPKNKNKLGRLLAEADTPSLLSFQAIDTMTPVEMNEDSWPVFSNDVTSRYNFFVTHHAAITFISLTSWIFRLESELNGDSEAGTDFRIGLLVNSQSTRDRIYSQPTADIAVPLAACNVLRDPDVGYFLLSATPYEPIALTFDTPEVDLAPIRQESPSYEREASMAPLDFYEPRPVFNPSHTFDEGSALPTLLERLRTSRHKTVVNQEVRLSPLTLQIFTDAHKVLADETHRLGMAAAEVFRRCELLQSELKQQVMKANEVKGKIDTINGSHRDGEADNAMYDRRVTAARDRQDQLTERLENLRKIVGKATTRDLSAKERAFVEEVKSMEASISAPDYAELASGKAKATPAPAQAKQLWKRLEDIKHLQADLAAEVEAMNKATGDTDGPATPSAELRIPQEVRRAKLQQVQGLLSRETALVDAVTARLERLQTSV